MTKEIKKLSFYDLLFLFCFIAVLLFMFWKSKYGFGGNDEAFYLLLPLRLLKGDSLFYDEQHICQLFSFLTYPVVKIYFLFFKDVDRIIIHFRYIYIFFQAITSLIIYLRVKRINKNGAIIASIVFMLYTPFNIMALSYNSICLMTLTLSLLFFVFNGKKGDDIISGLLFAASVLCCPYLAISYFLYSAAVLYFLLIKKKDQNLFSVRKWFHLTIGITALAILFLLFVFSRTSLLNVIKSLPYVVIDASHPSRSIFQVFFDFLKSTVFFTDYSTIIFALYFVLLVVYLVNKERQKFICYYFVAAVLITILYLLHIFTVDGYINYLMYPISILGFFVILFDRSEIKEKYWFFYIAAVLYSFYLSLSSNTGTYAITSASTVATVISIVSITSFLSNCRFFGKITYKMCMVSAIALFLMMLIFEGYSRYSDVFSRTSISTQDRHLESGPYKDVFTNEYYENTYQEALIEVDEIRSCFDERKIVFFSNRVYMYLIADDFNICAPSSGSVANSKMIDKMYE